MNSLEEPYNKAQTLDFLTNAGMSEPPLVYAVDKDDDFIGYVIFHDYDDLFYKKETNASYNHKVTGFYKRLTSYEELQYDDKVIIVDQGLKGWSSFGVNPAELVYYDTGLYLAQMKKL